MSTTAPLNDASYWQQRAEEARQLAATLRDPVAQQTVLEIAGMYSQLASMAKVRPLSL
jgi:hypothetical protein